MVLEADAALVGAILQPGVVEADLVDDLAVELDRYLASLADDVEAVPFTSRLYGVLFRRYSRNDSARVVVGQSRALLLAGGIIDLDLDAFRHGALLVSAVKIEAAVAALLYLVIKLDLEVLVLFLEPEVGIVALSAPLAGSRCQGHNTILSEDPIALGVAVLVEVA